MLCLSGFELYSRWVPLTLKNSIVVFENLSEVVSTGVEIALSSCLLFLTFKIMLAGADPHRFPQFYGNRSHFS